MTLLIRLDGGRPAILFGATKAVLQVALSFVEPFKSDGLLRVMVDR